MKRNWMYLMLVGSMLMGCGDENSAPVEQEPVDLGTISIGGTTDFADPLGAGMNVEISLLAADGVEAIRIYSDGAFSFQDKLIEGETYSVVITDNSSGGMDCSVINGTGVATGVNITNIVLECD